MRADCLQQEVRFKSQVSTTETRGLGARDRRGRHCPVMGQAERDCASGKTDLLGKGITECDARLCILGLRSLNASAS